LVESWKSWGPRETLQTVPHYYRAKRHETIDRFDERYNVETSQMVDLGNLEALGPVRNGAVHYWPTREREFTQMMRSLPAIDYADYTFIDFGCGKGRVVLMASGLPFNRVIGVDFSPRLITQAKQNIAQYTGMVRTSEVEVLVCDAAKYPPPGGNLLVYLFDPFGPDVLASVLASLTSPARQDPSQVVLLYYCPQYPDIIREAGFTLIGEDRGENWPWRVYSADPRRS
jgi:SAM-dependent methyltransferase